MAAHLEKISKRLWEQPPEKDVLLLKKLQTSKYDTSTKNTDRDIEMEAEIRRLRTNQKRNGMSTLANSNINQATDWNTVKGSVKVRVKRR
jgi:isochorismate hydrolase